MNHNYLLLSFILFCGISNAQNVDFNKIIIPSDITGLSFEEKLVRLAWQNYPSNISAQHEVESAKHKIGMAGSGWLNLISISGNLNEFNINPDVNPNENNFYPRYNIGVNIALGSFIEIPKTIKIAKEEHLIAQQNLNEQKLLIRGEVLTRYQQYLKAKSLYELQTQNTESNENNFSVVRVQFLNEEATLDEYNEALEKLNAEKAKNIIAETDYHITRISLETILGVELDSVE